MWFFEAIGGCCVFFWIVETFVGFRVFFGSRYVYSRMFE